MNSENFPPKPKPQRIESPGTARFITFGCFHHHRLFKFKRLRELFLEDLIWRSREVGIHIWAWVLMPNHVHLLLFAPDGGDVRKFLQNLKRTVARKGLRWLREHQPEVAEMLLDPQGKLRFWQLGGGHDSSITDIDQIYSQRDYIHRNPVKAGIVGFPEQYQHSSFNEWHTEEHQIINLKYFPHP